MSLHMVSIFMRAVINDINHVCSYTKNSVFFNNVMYSSAWLCPAAIDSNIKATKVDERNDFCKSER